MPCSHCHQKGHNVRTCPHKEKKPKYPPVTVEFAGGPLPKDLKDEKTKKAEKKTNGLPRTTPKKTCNRDEKIPSDTWLIPDEVLLKCEEKAIRESEDPRKQPKHFLKSLYATTEYKRNVGKVKRGDRAKNWKKEGKFECPSLHKADNIYQCLGKRVWISDHGGGRANTWINKPVFQCQVITKFSGEKCLRSVGEGMGCRCTQHFNLHKN